MFDLEKTLDDIQKKADDAKSKAIREAALRKALASFALPQPQSVYLLSRRKDGAYPWGTSQWLTYRPDCAPDGGLIQYPDPARAGLEVWAKVFATLEAFDWHDIATWLDTFRHIVPEEAVPAGLDDVTVYDGPMLETEGNQSYRSWKVHIWTQLPGLEDEAMTRIDVDLPPVAIPREFSPELRREWRGGGTRIVGVDRPPHLDCYSTEALSYATGGDVRSYRFAWLFNSGDWDCLRRWIENEAWERQNG